MVQTGSQVHAWHWEGRLTAGTGQTGGRMLIPVVRAQWVSGTVVGKQDSGTVEQWLSPIPILPARLGEVAWRSPTSLTTRW